MKASSPTGKQRQTQSHHPFSDKAYPSHKPGVSADARNYFEVATTEKPNGAKCLENYSRFSTDYRQNVSSTVKVGDYKVPCKDANPMGKFAQIIYPTQCNTILPTNRSCLLSQSAQPMKIREKAQLVMDLLPQLNRVWLVQLLTGKAPTKPKRRHLLTKQVARLLALFGVFPEKRISVSVLSSTQSITRASENLAQTLEINCLTTQLRWLMKLTN